MENLEEFRIRLQTDSIDDLLLTVMEVRDCIETVHTSNSALFLQQLFPTFIHILKGRIPPQLEDNQANRVRSVLWDIITRLPHTEHLQPYVTELVDMAMSIIRSENEGNTTMIVKCIFDLHKVKQYRSSMEHQIKPFLDFVVTVYRNFKSSAIKIFGPEGVQHAMTIANIAKSTPNDETGESKLTDVQNTKPLLVSVESFRVMTECPIVVMFFFQLYHKYVSVYIPELIPMMVNALSLVPPGGVPVMLLNEQYQDLLQAQVKTLSFLTYLLRGFNENMKPQQKMITSSVISLLKRIPANAPTIRKDLLIACRHIFITEFRNGFLQEIDGLLEEETMLGGSKSYLVGYDSLKALACATLVDLLENIRNELNLKQVTQVIIICTRNLHDPTLPATLKCNSVKLLLNFVDTMYNNTEQDPTRGKSLLLRVLRAFVEKFGTLRRHLPLVEEAELTRIYEKNERHSFEDLNSAPENFLRPDGSPQSLGNFRSDLGEKLKLNKTTENIVYSVDIEADVIEHFKKSSNEQPSTGSDSFYASRIWSDISGYGPSQMSDTLRDMRVLVKTIVNGLKTVMYCSTTYRRKTARSVRPGGRTDHQDTYDRSQFIMDSEERKLVGKLFKWGLQCMFIYTETRGSSSPQNDVYAKEGYEVLNTFANAFTVLDPYNLRVTIGPHIPTLYACIIEDSYLICIAQQLLANNRTSQVVADVLLSFLLFQMDDVIGWDERDSRTSMSPSSLDQRRIKANCRRLEIRKTSSKSLWVARHKDILEAESLGKNKGAGVGGEEFIGPGKEVFNLSENVVNTFLPSKDRSESIPTSKKDSDFIKGNKGVSADKSLEQMENTTVKTESTHKPAEFADSKENVLEFSRMKDSSSLKYTKTNQEEGPLTDSYKNEMSRANNEEDKHGKPVSEHQPAGKEAVNLRASVIMRLFKLVFGSISVYKQNETILRPHLQTLILSCLRYAARVRNSFNFFHLMRALFRSIAGGKFEQSYKEIFPILPLVLSELFKMFKIATDESTRSIIMELILTVPVRLGSLIPYLPIILRVTTHAISPQQRGDVHALGLRTLEFMADNLHIDYIFAVLNQDFELMGELMGALCSNLRPLPYSYGAGALRLLGKLGGRNRHFLLQPLKLTAHPEICHTEDIFQFNLRWQQENDINEDNFKSKTVSEEKKMFVLPSDKVVLNVCALLDRMVVSPPDIGLPINSSSSLNADAQGYSFEPYKPPTFPKASATKLEILTRHKKLCYKFVTSCLGMLSGVNCPAITTQELIPEIREQSNIFDNEQYGGERAKDKPILTSGVLPDSLRLKAQHAQKLNVVSQVLRIVIISAADPILKEEAMGVLYGLAENIARITTPVFAEIKSVETTLDSTMSGGQGVATTSLGGDKEGANSPHTGDSQGVDVGSLPQSLKDTVPMDVQSFEDEKDNIDVGIREEGGAVPPSYPVSKGVQNVALPGFQGVQNIALLGFCPIDETPFDMSRRQLEDDPEELQLASMSLSLSSSLPATLSSPRARSQSHDFAHMFLEKEEELAATFSPLNVVLDLMQFKNVISPEEFTMALSLCLEDTRTSVQHVALSLIHYIITNSSLRKHTEKPPKIQDFNIFWGRILVHSLINTLCDACYSKRWCSKLGGCLGLSHLIPLVRWEVLRVFECKILRSLLFVIKEHPREVSFHIVEDAHNAVIMLLRYRYIANFEKETQQNRNVHSKLAETDTECISKGIHCSIATEGDTLKEKVDTKNSKSLEDTVIDSKLNLESMDVEVEVKHLKKENTVEVSDAVVRILALELCHWRHDVRDVSKKALELIAELKGVSVTDVLFPVRKKLRELAFPFPKQLRVLQVSHQLGVLEGSKYLLCLKPPLFDTTVQRIHESIISLLAEVHSICETNISEESWVEGGSVHQIGLYDSLPGSEISKFGYPQPPYTTNVNIRDTRIASELPYDIQFKVSAVQLMHAVLMNCPGVFICEDPNQMDRLTVLKNNCIAIFFRCLTNSSEHIVEVAEQGVLFIANSNKSDDLPQAVPKEILQASLHPILKNLYQIQKISLPIIQGLSRLLTILSKWFNATLGDKLFEFLKHFLQPEVMQSLGDPKGWRSGEEPDIGAAVLGLFCLLPAEANYVESLIIMVLQLNSVLHRYVGYSPPISPYIVPLTKYLSKFVKDTLDFFMTRERLLESRFSSLFIAVIKLDESAPLRQHLRTQEASEKFLSVCFSETMDTAKRYISQKARAASMTDSNTALEGITSKMGHADTAEQKNSNLEELLELVQSTQISMDTQLMVVQSISLQARAGKSAVPPLPAQQQGALEAQTRAAEARLEELRKAAEAAKNAYDSAQALHEVAANQNVSTPSVPQQQLQSPPMKTRSGYALNQLPGLISESAELQYLGIRIIYELVKRDETYLSAQSTVAEVVRQIWRNLARQSVIRHKESLEPGLSTQPKQELDPKKSAQAQHECKLLIKILMSYFKTHKHKPKVLYELLATLLRPTTVDYSFLRDFYRYDVPAVTSVAELRSVFELYLKQLSDQDIYEELKIQASKSIIIPILGTIFGVDSIISTFEDKNVSGKFVPTEMHRSLFDSKLLNLLVRNVTNLKMSENKLHCVPIDPNRYKHSVCLRVELLKFLTLMLEFFSGEMYVFRPELLSFGWSNIEEEYDLVGKHWAYVFLCKFIRKYDTPRKITMQIYVTLLRTHQPEVKDLVQIGLDVVAPVLLFGLGKAEMIKAIKWTRKVMYEEGHMLQHMIHIFQVIVRNPTTFYPYRANFMSQMVGSLQRLGLSQNCPFENRPLSISLAEVLIGWELHRRERARFLQTGDLEVGFKRSFDGDSDAERAKFMKTGDSFSMQSNQHIQQLKLQNQQKIQLQQQQQIQLQQQRELQHQHQKQLQLQHQQQLQQHAQQSSSLEANEQQQLTAQQQKQVRQQAQQQAQAHQQMLLKHQHEQQMLLQKQASQMPLTSMLTSVHNNRTSNSSEDVTPMNDEMRDILMNFLVKMVFFSKTLSPKDPHVMPLMLISEKALQLLNRALDIWPEANISYFAFDRYLNQILDCTVNMTPEQRAEILVAKITQPVMEGALDVLLMMLEVRGPQSGPSAATGGGGVGVSGGNPGGVCNPLVVNNIARIDGLLQLFFSNDNMQIRSRLCELVKRIAQLYSPLNPPESFRKCNFYGHLNQWLEKRINTPSTFSIPASHVQSYASLQDFFSNEKKDRNAEETGNLNTPNLICSIFPAVRMVESIVEAAPPCIDVYANMLYKLFQRMTKEHLQYCATMAKLQNLDHKLYRPNDFFIGPRVMATPTIGVLYTAFHQSDTPYRSLDIRGANFPAGLDEKGLSEVLLTFITTLKLLGKAALSSTLNSKLPDFRKHIVAVLSTLLECSDCAPVLNAIVRMVKEWLLSPKHTINLKDKSTLLSKMSNFDRLPEVDAQPLVREYLSIVDALIRLKEENIEPDGSSPYKWVIQSLPSSYPAGLFTTEPELRKIFFDRFCASAGIRTPSNLLVYSFNNDWSNLANRFWPSIIVEQILSCVDSTQPLSVNIGAHLCIPNWGVSLEKEGEISNSVALKLPFRKHLMELSFESNGEKKCVCESFISTMRELLHADTFVADYLLKKLLPKCWDIFCEEQQNQLVSALEGLFEKPYHRQMMLVPQGMFSQAHYVNTIQSLVQSLVAFRPLPVLPLDMLGHLAKHYNIHHNLLPIVEYQILTCAPSYRASWIRLGTYMYDELCETDLKNSLHRRFSIHPLTSIALSFEGSGLYQQAQRAYMGCIAGETGQITPGHTLPPATEIELEAWEEHWIECARNLGQWHTLAEFSCALQYPSLLAESAFKTSDWNTIQNVMATPTMQAMNLSGHTAALIYEFYVLNFASDTSKIEALSTTAIQYALHQWQLLPKMYTGSCAHKAMLHQFHQIVELQESKVILRDLAKYVHREEDASYGLSENKKILSAWRNRLPNRWDPIMMWDDIFCWRTEFFDHVRGSVIQGREIDTSSFKDISWNILKYCHEARKHGLIDTSTNFLNKLGKGISLGVNDVFSKLREQLLLCYASPNGYNDGLNLISNTDLEYFDAQQKSEIYRLKGVFLSSINAKPEANSAFSMSLQMCKTYGKAWYSWAKYCDSILLEQVKQVNCAAQSMACYLQAVSYKHEPAKLMIPRVLWQLTMDDEKQSLAHTLESYGKTLPELVWIPWIPQLLTCLTRSESFVAKHFLRLICTKYPQSLHYTMRAYLLERRELPPDPLPMPVASNASLGGSFGGAAGVSTNLGGGLGGSVGGVGGPDSILPPQNAESTASIMGSVSSSTGLGASVSEIRPVPTAANHTDELMATLRRAHPSLGAELETLIEEIIVHFRPDPLEELLSTLYTLLLKCFQISYVVTDGGIPTTLKNTLTRVWKKFFNSQAGMPQSFRKKAFILEHRSTFERDFISDDCSLWPEKSLTSPGNPSNRLKVPFRTLPSLIWRLKKWKHMLQIQVLKNAGDTQLQICSPHLAQMHSEIDRWKGSVYANIEIPGQYSYGIIRELRPECHPRILRFHDKVTVMHRHGLSQRRFSLLGSNGHRYYFLVQFASPHLTRSDERMAQLHAMTRKVLELCPQSRARELSLYVPVVVPITPRMRMMEDTPDLTNLGDIYDADMQHRKLDPDGPMMLTRERVSHAIDRAALSNLNHDPRAIAELIRQTEQTEKLSVYNEIKRSHVPSNMLLKFVHTCMNDAESMWALKRIFAQQMGITCLLSYAFTCIERYPQKLAFNIRTGQILGLEFRPGYTHQGFLDPSEDVPFRLTRNISTFLSPFLIDGVLAPSMVATVQALVMHRDALQPYFSLVLRDDLVSWHTSKSAMRSESEQRVIERSLSDRINRNVLKVMERLDLLMPRDSSRTGSGTLLPNAPVDRKIFDLIESAQNEENLANMNCTWMAWV